MLPGGKQLDVAEELSCWRLLRNYQQEGRDQGEQLRSRRQSHEPLPPHISTLCRLEDFDLSQVPQNSGDLLASSPTSGLNLFSTGMLRLVAATGIELDAKVEE